MNGCEFCGIQTAELWFAVDEERRLFCTESHFTKFDNIMKSLKFHAGWSTVEMLISEQVGEVWHCKAYRGTAEIEFQIRFGNDDGVDEFISIST